MCAAVSSMDDILRNVNVYQHVICPSLSQITTRGLFVTIDSTEEGLEVSTTETIVIDTSKDFPYEREFDELKQTWEHVKVLHSTKSKVDVVTQERGDSVWMLVDDWNTLI